MRFCGLRRPQGCTGLESWYVLADINNAPPKHPLSIGLFTSPHLVSVRERIRVNGVPISEEGFVKYFFEVWDRLEENKTVIPSSHTPYNVLTTNSFIRQNTLIPNCIPHIFVF